MQRMDVSRFRTLPLLGILRGIDHRAIGPVIDAAVGAGLNSIEITMNTPGAAALIRRATDLAGDDLMVGAGTVLDIGDLDAALNAGASFVVSPTLRAEVAVRCIEQSIPMFPGALTPTEIDAAGRAGATMVKVFPASCFGPGYLREVHGPLATVELLACGGVNAANLGDYFASGAAAVAFGASVFRPSWLAARDFASIRRAIDELVQSWRTWRDSARARPV